MVNWKIPLSDIDYGDEELSAVKSVIESRWLSMGKLTEQFEKAVGDYLRCEYCLALTNCTAALHLALLCCDIKAGDEVIVPSLTFAATSNSVIACGGKPVFADISSDDYPNISASDIESKITEKTKAIIVVHYAGYPCEMDEIMNIAEKHNLKVIEDAAHAIGGFFQDKPLGTIGDFGCFSFFANKNLATGEGGLLTGKSKVDYEKARLLRSHGLTSMTWQRHNEQTFQGYDVLMAGYNYRPTEITAALGIEQLKKLDRNNSKRKEIVKLYYKYLSDIHEIQIPFKDFEGRSAYHIFPILARDKNIRNSLIKSLNNAGIQTSYHYYPIHKFTFYKKNFGEDISLPITEDYCEREITLPLHQGMSEEDVIYITDSIKNALR